MRNLVIGCFLFLLLGGCKHILKKVYRLTQPEIETYDSLSSFLESYKLDTTEILVFKDTSTLHNFLSNNKGIPDALFFNENGNFVDYRSKEASCNGEVDLFFEKMSTINRLDSDQGNRVKTYLKDLVYAKNQMPFRIDGKEKIDAYVLVTWAKYVGKLNKTKIYNWEQKIKSTYSENLKIKLIKVNLDYQKNWGLSDSDLPKFEY